MDAGTGIGGAPADQEDPRADLIWGTVPRLVEDAGGAPRRDRGAGRRRRAPDLRAAGAGGRSLRPGLRRGRRRAPVTGSRSGRPTVPSGCSPRSALLRAGAVLVPLNTRFKGGEAAYILRNAGAQTLVTVRGFLGYRLPRPADRRGRRPAAPHRPPARRRRHRVRVARRRQPSRPCGLQDSSPPARPSRPPSTAVAGRRPSSPTTSPTSSSPRAPPDTRRGRPRRTPSRCARSAPGRPSSGLAAGDRYLVVNPFFHTFGYKAGILACLMAGATVVPEPVFDATAVMQRIAEERISVLPGPPTLYQTLLADPGRALARPVVAPPRA